MPDNEWRMRMITRNNINKELNELDKSGPSHVRLAAIIFRRECIHHTDFQLHSFNQDDLMRWQILGNDFSTNFNYFSKARKTKPMNFIMQCRTIELFRLAQLNWEFSEFNCATALTSTMHIWQWHQQNRLIFECVLWNFIESNWHVCWNKHNSSFSRQIK